MTLSIDYDLEKREIHIPVRIDSQLNVLTLPVAVPAGQWTLCWDVDVESVKYANFVLPGVERQGSLAPHLELECKYSELKGNCCRAAATNTVEHTNGCAVDLYFQGHDNGVRFSHDPTIAVTPDPLGGGKKPYAGRPGKVLPVKA
jgi:hypothetical protein